MRIAVLGTLGMVWVAEVERLPRPGEVVPARRVTVRPGGAGAVQALAAVRLGAEVSVYGCVGRDGVGEEVLATLSGVGVWTGAVERIPGLPTGATLVLAGPERIGAGSARAAAQPDPGYVNRHLPEISGAAVVLLDLDLPPAAVTSLLHGLPSEKLIVGTHPPQDLGLFPWDRLSVVVGTPGELGVEAGWEAEGRHPLLAAGVRNIVVTGGPEGTYLLEAGGATRFPGYGQPLGFPARAVDAFAAALATRLAAGRGLYEAMGFAAAAAALTRFDEGRFPTSAEVLALLAEGPRFPGAPPD
ncbi:MAG: PfkB family carbohydrate kinase [Candidatus Bipolaricaulota bacterium]|nr:PfkB family carbohydrate kinase [Candidatus Bipolaricaulota bacterium]